jgi:pyruvate kinase
MRRHRKAKIVATLGPASSDEDTIRALFEAGADVFRFNFSHGAQQDHQSRYDIVRKVEQETGRPIAVLADLESNCFWMMGKCAWSSTHVLRRMR